MRTIVLFGGAIIPTFYMPIEMASTVSKLKIPRPGSPKEEWTVEGTIEININSTFGRKAEIRFDMSDRQGLIDIDSLLNDMSDTFAENAKGWGNFIGDMKKYRLVLEEV